MSGVKRVYAEKKQAFAVQAKALQHEIKSYLGIRGVTNVRVLIRYDIENLSDETFERACNGVFAEPPVDTLYKEMFPMKENERAFSVEYLQGSSTREQTPLYSVCSSSGRTKSRLFGQQPHM